MLLYISKSKRNNAKVGNKLIKKDLGSTIL